MQLDISGLKPIRDLIYDDLRTAILQGELKPQARIVEKEYADKYRVSRTPVREAIRKLENEGLLQYIPRKGVVVKNIAREEIAELYAIRMALEELSVRAAVENITATEIEGLKRAVEEMERYETAENTVQLEKACEDYNRILITASKMPRLTGMISSLQENLQRFKKITLSRETRRERVVAEHKEILQAVMARDKDRAAALVRQHLEGARQTLLANKTKPAEGGNA